MLNLDRCFELIYIAWLIFNNIAASYAYSSLTVPLFISMILYAYGALKVLTNRHMFRVHSLPVCSLMRYQLFVSSNTSFIQLNCNGARTPRGGFLKCGYSQIIHFRLGFSMIFTTQLLGYHHLWNPPTKNDTQGRV